MKIKKGEYPALEKKGFTPQQLEMIGKGFMKNWYKTMVRLSKE